MPDRYNLAPAVVELSAQKVRHLLQWIHRRREPDTLRAPAPTLLRDKPLKPCERQRQM